MYFNYPGLRIQESQICQKLFIFEQNFNKFHGENRIANPDPDPGFFQLLDPDPDQWKYFRSDPDPGKNFPDPQLWQEPYTLISTFAQKLVLILLGGGGG